MCRLKATDKSFICFFIGLFYFIGTLATVHALQFDSLLCDGRIISIGDRAGEVVAKCGPPTYSLQREQKVVERDDLGNKIITTIIIDDWTFNFGPDRFQYRLLLKNGRVTKIESLDYGY